MGKMVHFGNICRWSCEQMSVERRGTRSCLEERGGSDPGGGLSPATDIHQGHDRVGGACHPLAPPPALTHTCVIAEAWLLALS